MKRIILAFALALAGFLPGKAQTSSGNLKITYVANEGFLMQSPSKKILIDALFTEGYNYFPVPPKAAENSIMEEVPPFDEINLYFLTHYHGDHCSSALVDQYLTRHRDISLVASKPSIVFINGNCFDFILLKKQFVELTPQLNQCLSKTVNNIPFKVYGLKHLSFFKDSIDMEQNMFNVSYLINMDGINVFHSGDIMMNAFEDYLKANKKWDDKVDVAFLYYKLLDSEADLKYVLSVLHPRYIVAMHTPPAEFEQTEKKLEHLKTLFPNIIHFEKPLDSQTIKL